MNAFRWTGGYRGGNDPRAIGSAYAANTHWVSSGGADGGGFLQIDRPAGSSGDGTYWNRPFSPIVGAGNGRGVDDPGASGTLTPQNFVATDGGGQLYNWGSTAKPGWYGHADYQNSFFDGTDFYLQVRVKADPVRTTVGNTQVGKLVWLSTTNNSYTAQELVTYSAFFQRPGGVGVPNFHSVYQGYNYAPLADVAVNSNEPGIQLGSELPGVCDPSNNNVGGCWSYSFGWDTLLYHVTPGHNGVADTRFEVWAAHEGDTKYVKIWDVIYPAYFDGSGNTSGAVARNGWNTLLLAIYQNGQTNSAYSHRFDQVIFSKAFIPCPR